MSNDELVREIIETYRAGDTGVYHGNWFMVKLSDEVRAEFDKRLSEGWWGLVYKGQYWVNAAQHAPNVAVGITGSILDVKKFEDASSAREYANTTWPVLGLSEKDFDIRQWLKTGDNLEVPGGWE